jgi:hypothetical protein
MMQQKNNLLVDDHLLSLKNMKETETDAFFYTRLKARMERENNSGQWNFPLKPIWVIGAMSFLLLLNVLMITAKNKTTKTQMEDTSSIKNFAASYDQSISSF